MFCLWIFKIEDHLCRETAQANKSWPVSVYKCIRCFMHFIFNFLFVLYLHVNGLEWVTFKVTQTVYGFLLVGSFITKYMLKYNTVNLNME